MVCAPKQDSSQANPLVRGTKTTTLLVGLYFYITFTISFNESTKTKQPARQAAGAGERMCFCMVKMAAIAPKGVFEDEEVMTVSYREEPYERHYDDFSRNWEEAA